MKRRVVANNQLPSRMPIIPSIVAWLALDHWNAPQWLYGAVGLLLLILWVTVIINIYRDEQTEIWPTK